MEKEIYTGKFIANAKGFGFVETEELETDIFIGDMDVRGAMHGDTVEVRIRSFRSGKRPEGTIVKILERGITEAVGTFQRRKTSVLSYAIIRKFYRIFLSLSRR